MALINTRLTLILHKVDNEISFNSLYFFTYFVIIYTLILVNFVVEKDQSAISIKKTILN